MPLFERAERKLWKMLGREPSWIDRRGSFRLRESYGRIQRANYAYGMLRAADTAKYFGKACVTVIEFGVASGAGLLNLISLASQIERETGVKFHVVGFDTGKGLPAVSGFKDHPELWNPGDFATEDREGLLNQIDGRAEIVWGDIGAMIGPFTKGIEASAPIGFIAVDVDIHSATEAALKCLLDSADRYNPAISIYFDDVTSFFASEWTGELAAISEFNAAHEMRKIGPDRSLPGIRPVIAAAWYSQMYVCHIFDHEARQHPRARGKLNIAEHVAFMAATSLR